MADKKEKMVRRVVTQSVTVVRDGKRVTPAMNKPFDFTADEAEYLDRISPAASRKSVNEDAGMAAAEEPVEGGDAGTDETAPEQDAKPSATKTPKRGAKKAAAKAEEAETEDEEEDDDI